MPSAFGFRDAQHLHLRAVSDAHRYSCHGVAVFPDGGRRARDAVGIPFGAGRTSRDGAHPERGPARALCELAVSNAAERVRQFRRDAEQDEQSLVRLGELLGIGYPQRIEAYDISNIGSEHPTAGMVVLEDGRLARSEYASFNIRTVDGTDDYASMREALSRRLAHLDDADGSFSHRPIDPAGRRTRTRVCGARADARAGTGHSGIRYGQG